MAREFPAPHLHDHVALFTNCLDLDANRPCAVVGVHSEQVADGRASGGLHVTNVGETAPIHHEDRTGDIFREDLVGEFVIPTGLHEFSHFYAQVPGGLNAELPSHKAVQASPRVR